MEGLEVIKQLVDSLTVSLTNILIKIEGINPILNRLSEEVKDDNSVTQETIDAIKELRHEIFSYHESMTKLPVTIKEIGEIYEKINSLDKKLDSIKGKTDKIPNITDQFDTNNKLLSPISKIADWIATPVGKLVTLLSLLMAIACAIETIYWIVETFITK